MPLRLRPRLAPLAAALLAAAPGLHAQTAPNDTRATAAALTVGEADVCSPLRGNTAEGSASLAEPSCAPPDDAGARRDLWYAFVAPGPSVTVALDADGGNVGTVWVEATDAAGTTLLCDAVTIWQRQRLRLDELVAGDSVYVQVAALEPASRTSFEICAFATPSCEPPRILQMTTGQNWIQLSFVNGDNTPALNGGRQFEAVAGVTPFTPGRDEPEVTAAGARSPLTLWGLTPGEFYRVGLSEVCGDGDQSTYVLPTQNFRQEDAGTPPGDSLQATDRDARPQFLAAVTTTCIGQPGTTRGATAEATAPAACGGEADDDVWYSLRPQGPQYRFLLTPAPGITSDLVLEVRDAELELVACVNDAPGGGAEVYDAYDLTVDQTYYARVYTAGAAEVADFEICAFAFDRPVVSDTGCTDALAITLDGTGAPGEFVDVVTSTGELVVSLENTQDLGAVAVSYYGAADSARALATDSVPVYYARNNVTIAPERQPSDSVTVRFYLAPEDLIGLAKLGAVSGVQVVAIPNQPTGSQGGASGGGNSGGGAAGGRTRRAVLFIPNEKPDVAVARVPAARCSADYPAGGFAAAVVGSGAHGNGVYLDVRVAGFSDFFFSSARVPLTREQAPPPSAVRELPRALGVYPNPTRGALTVSWTSGADGEAPTHYQLLDAAGRVAAADRLTPGVESTAIELPSVPEGVYTLVATAGGRPVGRARVAIY